MLYSTDDFGNKHSLGAFKIGATAKTALTAVGGAELLTLDASSVYRAVATDAVYLLQGDADDIVADADEMLLVKENEIIFATDNSNIYLSVFPGADCSFYLTKLA